MKGFAPSHSQQGLEPKVLTHNPHSVPCHRCKYKHHSAPSGTNGASTMGSRLCPQPPAPAAAPASLQLPYADAASAEVTQLKERADKCQALTQRHPPPPTGSWLAAPPRGLQMPLLPHNHPTFSPCTPCYLNSNKRYDKKKLMV